MSKGKKQGKPSLYNPEEHPKAARDLVRDGKSLWDVAQVFGVNESTINDWKHRHPEFAAQIALAYDDRTRDVEAALLHRAKGYSHASEKIVTVSDGQGAGSHVERVKIIEHYPPDTEAAKYWLKNRAGKDWKDRQEVEHSGAIDLTVALSERLMKARERAQKQPTT